MQKLFLYKKCRTIIKTKGIEIAADQAALIFNEDTEEAYQTIIDQEIDSIDQKKLIGYL